MEEIEKYEDQGEIQADMSAYKRSKVKVWISAGIILVVVAAIFIGGSLLLLGDAFFGICAAAICLAVLLVVWLPKELKRVKRNYCQECGARYDYQSCVEWEVDEIEIKEKRTNPNSNKKQIVGVRIEHVEFTCTCAKCGSEASFMQKYQTGEIYDDGSVKKRSVESVIKKYFQV